MIKIITVGKIKDKNLTSLIEDYKKKISYFTNIVNYEVKDEPIPKNLNNSILEKINFIEGERILKLINKDEYVIVLDLRGESFDSIKLSKKIDNIISSTSTKITFVIGGSLGLGKNVIERSNLRWKLSDCTFTHQLVKLLLYEQIYRIYTILNNIVYHK